MAVSGSTDYSLNRDQIIAKAFNILGKGQEGEAITSAMTSDGSSTLNLLLKTIGTNPRLFLQTETTKALTASTASYAISPKPQRVLSVRRRNSDSYDVPMRQMSRQEYYDTPNKTVSASVPVSWYYDPQLSTGTIHVWPAPDSTAASEYTLQITYLRRISDMDAASDDLDMPQEWLETIVWMLADRLEPEYPVNDPRLAMKIENRAARLFAQLEGFDEEVASIYLEPEPDYG